MPGSSLKTTLQSDLTQAMRARDDVTLSTLRMALAAITREEVAGKHARELSDAEVVAVLNREAKKRVEAAEAFASAGRSESAARETAEGEVLKRYLPTPLSEQEVEAIVSAAVASAESAGLSGGRAMGAVMKAVQPQVAGRADGAAVAAQVKAALGL